MTSERVSLGPLMRALDEVDKRWPRSRVQRWDDKLLFRATPDSKNIGWIDPVSGSWGLFDEARDG